MEHNLFSLQEITVKYNPIRPMNDVVTIRSSKDTYGAVLNYFNQDTLGLQEQFVVLYLNRANRVIGGYKHSSGGITETTADIRLILSIALKSVSTGVIFCHNHPSGNLKPSQSDINLTKRFVEACNLFNISVIDHLIITPYDEYYSFSDEGLI